MILLSAVVLTATLITCFALFSGAESVAPEMKIGYCNLSFADNIRIKYAVNSNVDNVELLVWRSPKSDYVYGTQDDILTNCYTENIDGVPHYIFDFDGFSAKNMTDYVYTRAHVKVGDVDYYSDVNKYSILQYAQNMIANSSDAKLKKLLTKMLEYGAAVQEYHGYKTDRLANATWYSVKLTAGTLPDGMREGLYLAGETVTLTAPETDADGGTFEGWYDGNNTKISSDATTTVTVSGNETYTPKYNSVTYSIGLEFVSNGDGTCYVNGIGTCTDTDIIIPPTSPDGDKVTSIGYEAFQYCTSLTSITIPDSVTSIGERAFRDCTSLTSITIPDSVASIGEYAFYDCTSLTSIAIPDSVTSIGWDAFNGCTSLASITIPDSVTIIDDSAFYDCTSLASITIGNGVTSIGYEAFYGCTSLTSITIPDGVTSIGEYAFYKCTSLKKVYYGGTADEWSNINIPSNNSELKSADYYEWNINDETGDGYWSPFYPYKTVIKIASKIIKCTDTEVILDVTIANNPGICIMTLNPKSSSEGIKFVEAINGDVFADLICGNSVLLDSGSRDTMKNGLIVKLKFEISEKLEAGDYTIELATFETINSDCEDVPCMVEVGCITIEHAEDCEC